MDPAYNKLLEERARQALKGTTLKQVLNRVRAIIGDQKTIEQEDLAREAMEILGAGEVPSPGQLAALELIVRLMRPAPLAKDASFEKLTADSAAAFPHWPRFQQAVKPFVYSIGRIDRLSLGGVGSDMTIGTGFLVSDELLVTNRHVLDELSRGSRALEKGQAVVRFKQEYYSPDDEGPVPIVGVEAVHATLDIALLKIEKLGLSDGREPLHFVEASVGETHAVVAVGYPCRDERNPIFISAIFGNRFGVKRAAPGVVIGVGPGKLFHDCSTLGGNSGSPLLSMETAEVVGLHREGRFMYRNEGVDIGVLKEFVQPHIA